ncbi:unnamed protein product [Arctia plantaginis]|uniref:Uncharacterized protein n=1 Tax=Arctia plantaginis TaxID=874455 RepID=A0A8S1ANW8_ARCPL|nr:unnamed protein product [Arctia plantaginis]
MNMKILVRTSFLIGSLLVAAVYWIFTTRGGEATQEIMWSPGSGLIEPEPWLQSADGGYAGWSPGSSAYAAWSPGAYLHLVPSTTTYVPTTTSTTQRTRRTRRTRLPSHLPPDSDPDSPKPPSSMSSPGSEDVDNNNNDNKQFSQLSQEPQDYPQPPELDVSDEDIKENYDDDKIHKPPSVVNQPPPEEDEPTTEPSMMKSEYDQPNWKSRDQNEEAYEENPQDLVNTRPLDKLPVEGWGYDYGN